MKIYVVLKTVAASDGVVTKALCAFKTEKEARSFIDNQDIDELLEPSPSVSLLDYQEVEIEDSKEENNQINSKDSTMLQSIWEKLCELEGKLDNILYAVVSRQEQNNSFWKDISDPNITPLSARQCWFLDGTCMNPHHDCINCPRPNLGGHTTTSGTNLFKDLQTTSITPNKVMYDGVPINNQEKKETEL